MCVTFNGMSPVWIKYKNKQCQRLVFRPSDHLNIITLISRIPEARTESRPRRRRLRRANMDRRATTGARPRPRLRTIIITTHTLPRRPR